VLNYLKERFIKEQFEQTILGAFVNPFYIARKGLLHNVMDLSAWIKGVTLDVGCGLKPYEKYCRSSKYLGLELDTEENRNRKKADFFL
jgi:hypothetical protein